MDKKHRFEPHTNADMDQKEMLHDFDFVWILKFTKIINKREMNMSISGTKM